MLITSNENQPNANTLITRYKFIILGGLILIVVLTLSNANYLSKQVKSQIISEEQHHALQTLLALQQTISVSFTHIEQMRSSILNARKNPELAHGQQVLSYINSFSQAAPSGTPWETLPERIKQQVGQLYVQSNSRDLSADISSILTMLSSVSTTHKLYPEFQWSYYYDANKVFTQLYPWLSHDDILGATGTTSIDDAIEVIYQAGGTYPLQLVGAEQNPKREMVWTTPYMDAGGKGMMISLLAPIYHEDVFVGAVGADITLKVLDKIVTGWGDSIGHLALVDQAGIVVADSQGALQGKTETVTHEQVLSIVPLGASHQSNAEMQYETPDGVWFGYPLPNTPWHLVIEITNKDIESYANKAIMPYVTMGGVFTLLLVLIGFYQHRNFSQPALQLAKFVEELPVRQHIVIPNIPQKWYHWFESAAKGEQIRRESLETITQQNLELENRVEERTRELKKALEELEATQEELIRNEKLAGLGALVAGVAHELNTPIGNALIVASSMKDLNRTFEDAVKEGLRKSVLDEYIQHNNDSTMSIERNLNRAAELISSFKQVATDQSSSQRRLFDLPEILHELRVTMMPNLTRNNITLEENLCPSLKMDSYPGALTQVLMNLVSNAVTHAFGDQENRVISITCDAKTSDIALINISDNGDGIEAEHLGKLFDPFFTTKLGQGGSGLGLNIVYNIVTGLLGGKITVESSPGKGAKFIIEIPMSAPETKDA
jgi:signal transduction histidine kinase